MNQVDDRLSQAHKDALKTSDSEFLRRCHTVNRDKEVNEACEQLRHLAHAYFTRYLTKKLKALTPAVLGVQEDEFKRHLRLEAETTQNETSSKVRREFLSQIESLSESQSASTGM
jgi:hypothetical protein